MILNPSLGRLGIGEIQPILVEGPAYTQGGFNSGVWVKYLAMVKISCAFGLEESWWLDQGCICFAKISASLIQTRTQLSWALFEKLKRLKNS